MWLHLAMVIIPILPQKGVYFIEGGTVREEESKLRENKFSAQPPSVKGPTLSLNTMQFSELSYFAPRR